ncbi:reverse transcriptase domain-containing protein [Legionella busanensis]|uniref:reverse transcriptase domain-containing protein n=1 Tax=Legionella busanensis TaxID=190655 RepID=UPI001C3FD2A0|nr:reverse transcriptase domain-containing protein [Legionella busanensis]
MNGLPRNIPLDKRVLQEWLKSGYVEQKKWFNTDAGTPQGGIISPMLANMVLDGLERAIKAGTKKSDKVNLVRYADDFIYFGRIRKSAHESQVRSTNISSSAWSDPIGREN